jgi:hypothetical protein
VAPPKLGSNGLADQHGECVQFQKTTLSGASLSHCRRLLRLAVLSVTFFPSDTLPQLAHHGYILRIGGRVTLKLAE